MKVSVLIPFLNPGKSLKRALDSMMDMDFQDFELVLVNNGSTDDSAEIAGNFKNIHHNTRVIDEPVPGIARALNTGLKHCSGDYIARMDADDLSLPGRLRLQAAYLDQHPDVGLVSGLVHFHSTLQNSEGMESYVNQINSLVSRDDIYHHRFVESPFAHPSVMYRKSLINRYGRYSEEQVPEDYELWLRWFQNGVIMDKLSVPVLTWNDHPGRASRNLLSYREEAFSRIRLKYLSDFLLSSTDPGKNLYIWGGGRLARKKALTLMEYGVRVHGFIDVNPKMVMDGYQVLYYQNLPPPEECFIVSLVSNRGRYREIAAFLSERNYRIGTDFLLAS